MTEERQNEIWAMLTQEEKDEFQSLYKCRNSKFDIGFNIALDEIFGKRNLTAQAEEKPSNGAIGTTPPKHKLEVESGEKPKEPRYKVGDKAIFNDKVVEIADTSWCSECFVVDEEGLACWISQEHLKPCSSASNVASKDAAIDANHVDYAQYRLDLAKEIAVAMIAANWEAADIPRDAVDDANEIVERLKETDNAD